MRNHYIHIKALLILFVSIIQNCSIISALSQKCSIHNAQDCSQLKPLANFWNVPTKDVPKLLHLEEKLITIDSILQPLLNGSYFGGTYIDIKVGQININTIDPSKEYEVRNSSKLRNYLNYLNFKVANNTLFQLNSTFNQIFKFSQNFTTTNCMFSIEPKDNNVVVYLNKDDPKNNRFIEKIENLDPKPIIKPFPEEVENEIIFNSSTLIEKRQLYLYVVGGSKIAAFFENRVKTCSAGFWVKKDDEDYVATAGHCARNIPPIPTFYLINRNYLIGKMEDYVFERNDVGFISKDGDEITLKPILRNKFYMEPTQYLLYYIVDSSDITSRGIHVCKSGYATGFTCGEVLAFDTVYKFDSGKIVNNAITVQLIGNSGDSGGSLYRYHDGDNPSLFVDAVGLYIGGTFNVGAAEPIDKIFDFGYDLVTLLD